MLNDSKLSHQFWEDATSTANYIHNHIPHKGINMKIPYEIINKTKVNYSNKEDTNNKINNKANKTINNNNNIENRRVNDNTIINKNYIQHN